MHGMYVKNINICLILDNGL